MKKPDILKTSRTLSPAATRHTRHLPLTSTVLVWAGLTFVTFHSYAAIVVVPGAQASIEGNTALTYPFEYTMRYQQGYAASDFASLTGPGLITQIAFRPDYFSGLSFSAALPDIQINLSTLPSTLNPEALNTTFASNVGADDSVVYARGPLTLSSNPGTHSPRNFDIVITLTTPFLYDPAQGGLLLDVRNYNGASTVTTWLDAVNQVNDGLGAVFDLSGNPNRATGSRISSGLVTQFTIQPVPEVSTFLAGALLLLPFGMSTLRRRRG